MKPGQKTVCVGLCKDGIHYVGRLKALYTSIPGRPVHSDTNSTLLGSIHPCWNYCTKTIHSHVSTTVYSQALIYRAE